VPVAHELSGVAGAGRRKVPEHKVERPRSGFFDRDPQHGPAVGADSQLRSLHRLEEGLILETPPECRRIIAAQGLSYLQAGEARQKLGRRPGVVGHVDALQPQLRAFVHPQGDPEGRPIVGREARLGHADLCERVPGVFVPVQKGLNVGLESV